MREDYRPSKINFKTKILIDMDTLEEIRKKILELEGRLDKIEKPEPLSREDIDKIISEI